MGWGSEGASAVEGGQRGVRSGNREKKATGGICLTVTVMCGVWPVDQTGPLPGQVMNGVGAMTYRNRNVQ